MNFTNISTQLYSVNQFQTNTLATTTHLFQRISTLPPQSASYYSHHQWHINCSGLLSRRSFSNSCRSPPSMLPVITQLQKAHAPRTNLASVRISNFAAKGARSNKCNVKLGTCNPPTQQEHIQRQALIGRWSLIVIKTNKYAFSLVYHVSAIPQIPSRPRERNSKIMLHTDLLFS